MRPLVFATYLAPCNRALYDFAAAACGGVLIDGDDWRELASPDYSPIAGALRRLQPAVGATAGPP